MKLPPRRGMFTSFPGGSHRICALLLLAVPGASAYFLGGGVINPVNYRLSASGFLEEIDRMQLEVREYLSLHPTEATRGV